MKLTKKPSSDDWLKNFRAECLRLRGVYPREIYKMESLSLVLLEREQRQLSLCWSSGRKPP